MRILLDECVDQRLRLLLAGHDCQTAAYAQLSGLKNGVLLSTAESAGLKVISWSKMPGPTLVCAPALQAGACQIKASDDPLRSRKTLRCR